MRFLITATFRQLTRRGGARAEFVRATSHSTIFDILMHPVCASLAQNRLCQLRIKACRSCISQNFSLDEVKQAVCQLKLGRSADPTGMVREIFKKCWDGLLYSLVEMVNTIKTSKNLPSDWNKIWVRTLKKKKGN